MVLKMTRFQHKNWCEKRCNLTRDICKIVFWCCEPNQTVSQKQILTHISGNRFLPTFFYFVMQCNLLFTIRPRSRLSFCCQTKSEENQTFTLPKKCLQNFNTVGVGWQKVGENQEHAFRRSEDSKYLLFSDKQNEGRRSEQKHSNFNLHGDQNGPLIDPWKPLVKKGPLGFLHRQNW